MAVSQRADYTENMRPPLASAIAAALTAAALAACSTPQSRIREHQTAFNAYPREVQDKIRAGRVDVGFTKEQVALALGRPARIYTRKTASSTREVWAYGGGGGSRVGLGFGMSSGGWGSHYGGGMDMMVDESAARDRLRVVFENGAVAVIENGPGDRGVFAGGMAR